MLSEHDRVVLDEIERELSEADPLLATELTEWRPRSTTRARQVYVALLATAALLMVLGVLISQPALFWSGVLLLSATIATRGWWPGR